MKNNIKLVNVHEKKSTLVGETLRSYTLGFKDGEEQKQIELSGFGKMRETINV